LAAIDGEQNETGNRQKRTENAGDD